MPKARNTISVKLYFWEQGIKSGWAAGTIALEANEHHGIKSDHVIFNNLEELMVKLHELLHKNDISLVMADQQGKIVSRLGKGYPLKAGPWRK